MERHDEESFDAIDLGAASVETMGQPGTQLEASVIGRPFGIADDE